MMISHGDSTKNLTIYPPDNPSVDCENPMWIEYEKEDRKQLL
jgi:hypothetical protein